MASRLRLREVRREDRNVDKLEKERPYWEENNNMCGRDLPYEYVSSDHRCERFVLTSVICEKQEESDSLTHPEVMY